MPASSVSLGIMGNSLSSRKCWANRSALRTARYMVGCRRQICEECCLIGRLGRASNLVVGHWCFFRSISCANVRSWIKSPDRRDSSRACGRSSAAGGKRRPVPPAQQVGMGRSRGPSEPSVPVGSMSFRLGPGTAFALPTFNPATSLREHCRRYLIHLDDHIGRNIIAPCRVSNCVGTLGFIKTIGLALVGAEKSKQPLHAFLIVDEVDCFCSLLCHFESFGEISLDHETWHGPLLCVMWFQCRCSRILSIKAVIFRRHAVVHDSFSRISARSRSPRRLRRRSMRAKRCCVCASQGHACMSRSIWRASSKCCSARFQSASTSANSPRKR